MARDAAESSEARRLAALHRCHILDTANDPRFDALARLAAEICDAPMALISFVDVRRQWFKAMVGLEQRETQRIHSFCSHAIMRPGEVMVVEDTAVDPRFAANPFVTGLPGVRFYAGAPICIEDGQALGTLCILDHVPRQFDAAGRRRLVELAGGVACMLELHRSAAQLERLSTHDALTGLANRSAFEARLEEAVAGALAGRPCGLLLIDVDALKEINESHGQQVGNAVLREVARRLKSVVRTGDLVARLGGDEFAVVMAGPVRSEAASALAGRVAAAMHPPMRLEAASGDNGAGAEVVATVSIGIALCPIDATHPAGLMRRADEGLFRAQRDGRGLFARIEGVAATVAASQQSLGDELAAGLAAGELSLVWQPYFDTASGRAVGCEALARWDHRAGGPIGPAVFIPVAEATGLSGRFDAWVLETACRAAVLWPGNPGVAINLSAHWFSDGDAVALVEATLRRCRLGPERLILEMTERTLVTHAHTARAQMTRLREMGVRIALDDFGVGFSSLATLRDFPFDKVKLDRAFTKDLVVDPRADAVARAVMQLGRALGMTVCAEGVETEAQLAFLRAEHCDMVQGYLLGRPSPMPQFLPSRQPASIEAGRRVLVS